MVMSSGEEPDTDNVVVIKNLSKVYVHTYMYMCMGILFSEFLLVKAK